MSGPASMSASLNVIKSAGLLFGLQVVQRGLGLISTLVLARLLTPAQFGVVALVALAIQFFELLAATGNQQYIVQKDEVTDDDLNTAWSMDVLLKFGLALLIVAASPVLADYFSSPDLTLALSVAAWSLPIKAFKNPGLMRQARAINYRPLFRLTLWQKGISFVVVITIALVYPSYWAIITGNLVAAAILAIGSYRVDRFRPRWTLIKLREQWRFSQWLLMRGIVGFTRSQIDSLMVSKFFGTTPLGGYNVVREIALLPALSAIIPMSEPLLAAIAKARSNPANLAYRVRFSIAVLVSGLIPIALFIMLYPKLIVTVLLGDQWQSYAHLLRPFGLFFFTFCLFALLSDAVIALGKVSRLFWFDVISTVLIVIVLFLTGTHHLSAMAWSRGWLAVATTVALLLTLARWIDFGLLRTGWLCLPSVLGSACAAWLVLHEPWTTSIAAIDFIIKGTVFVFCAAIISWILASVLLKHHDEWHQVRSLIKGLTKR